MFWEGKHGKKSRNRANRILEKYLSIWKNTDRNVQIAGTFEKNSKEFYMKSTVYFIKKSQLWNREDKRLNLQYSKKIN